MNELNILLAYFFIFNGYGFISMAKDKRYSQQGHWRIPEKRFWIIGILGGAIGVYLGMRIYHHKTKHKTFTIGMPLIILLNLLFYGYAIYFLA